MISIELAEPSLGKMNVIRQSTNHKAFVLGSTCVSPVTCTPYKAVLGRGKYLFELWGGGNEFHRNGGFVSGEVLIPSAATLYFFVGPMSSPFNSVNIKTTKGTFGNGASDVRLFYEGNWSSFESLKSRIIVAGAGGNNIRVHIGDVLGHCTIDGNYGYGGGLSGYFGIQSRCNDLNIQNNAVHPGLPGTQTQGGAGGFGGICASTVGGGENGTFGIGGLPGKGCIDSLSKDGYAGSGGYYGSGGGSGESYQFSPTKGTSGGSSFISGHRGCDAIKEESTSNNIIHTGNPWHYSGFIFGHSIMIDGSGHQWTNESSSSLQKLEMPNPKGGVYQSGFGHSGSGFIRITELKSQCQTIKHFSFRSGLIHVLFFFELTK